MKEQNHIFMPENHMEELYTSGNALVKFVHNNRLQQIVKMTPDSTGLNILDAGCGEGHLIEKLNQKNSMNTCYGIDITDVALQKARIRCPYAKFVKSDLSYISFEDCFFDVVICTEVLEHIFEYKRVIKELKRVLKNNGLFLITYPNETTWTISRFLLRRKPVKVPDHVNSFNPEKMSSLVEMTVVSSVNLPFGFPFFASLGNLTIFKKAEQN